MISSRELTPKRHRSLKSRFSGEDGDGDWLICRGAHWGRAKFHLINRGSRLSGETGIAFPCRLRKNRLRIDQPSWTGTEFVGRGASDTEQGPLAPEMGQHGFQERSSLGAVAHED